MATLDQVIATLPSEALLKGKAFERLCKWFLENDPVYAGQLRRVWLWEEWPGRWGADNGIDLVAEAFDGGLWAIQAKAYGAATSVTKADVDSFLSESNREQFGFRLLIATTDAIGANARRVISGQEKPAAVVLLSDLRSRRVDWPIASQAPVRRVPATPRAHQQEALSAIRTVASGERGRVIMACGTGKTLVQLWAHEQLESQRTLVVVPSLFLVAQVMQEWLANRVVDFEFLAVCSDETVVSSQADSFVANVSELGVPVTTDPERIRRFLDASGRRVIFSTYQSSARVAEALEASDIRFDLVLADEAHQLAGDPTRDFAAVLDDARIPAKRRLFFTATPRYFTGQTTRSGGDQDLEVASMDDGALFGPEVHRLSFGEAIRRDLLSDYQVVVVGVTDRQAYELASTGSFVQFAEATTDARSLARQIGLAKAMHDYSLKRVISFHSRVQAAKQFAESLPTVIGLLPAARAPQGRLVFDYVSGEMATGQRRQKLDRLRNKDPDEFALLANARCLSEGVDVPSINGVAFIDPRRSQIDIVQAVGRAIRRSDDKSLGTIVIPVFVPEGETNEAVLANSAFEPVWSVVRALRDHDEALADQLDAARRSKASEGRITADDLPSKIILDLPEAIVGDAFIDAIVTRIVERTTTSWEEGFARLEQYVNETGNARVPTAFTSSDGCNLGGWVSNQRDARNRSKMPEERIARLDALGFVWDKYENQWEDGFSRLQEYFNKHGHSRVPLRLTSDGGFKLGSWVSRQRRNRGNLTADQTARLDSLGFVWDVLEANWEDGFACLQEYVSEHGNPRVPSNLTSEDGFKLGTWVSTQRYVRTTLSVERVKRLDDLGFLWDPTVADWEDGFDHLEQYIIETRNSRIPKDFRCADGFKLGQWASRQRTARDTMSVERLTRLDGLDFVWDLLIANWEGGFASLKRYVNQTGNARVPSTFTSEDGYRLGTWVNHQRDARNKSKMSEERIERLDTVGFVWVLLEAQWEDGVARLEEYIQLHGNARVPNSFEDGVGFKLGQWVGVQRKNFNRLSTERKSRLDDLGFVWDVLAEQWDDAYACLQKYVAEHNHSRVPVRYTSEDGYKLGPWVTRQRLKRRNLFADQTARLDSLGFVWDALEAQWEDGISCLEEYIQQRGNARVPGSFKGEGGFKLGQWVSIQRRTRSRLSPERTARLNALGFVWDARLGS